MEKLQIIINGKAALNTKKLAERIGAETPAELVKTALALLDKQLDENPEWAEEIRKMLEQTR